MCREGNSVFFTGCAGTGKSLLLKHILQALPKDTTFVTASTGLAASALGGITINAFAGLSVGSACCVSETKLQETVCWPLIDPKDIKMTN